jgi:hypothetical protein
VSDLDARSKKSGDRDAPTTPPKVVVIVNQDCIEMRAPTTATSPTTTATFDDGTSRYLAIDTNVVVANNHSCLKSPTVEGELRLIQLCLPKYLVR